MPKISVFSIILVFLLLWIGSFLAFGIIFGWFCAKERLVPIEQIDKFSIGCVGFQEDLVIIKELKIFIVRFVVIGIIIDRNLMLLCYVGYSWWLMLHIFRKLILSYGMILSKIIHELSDLAVFLIDSVLLRIDLWLSKGCKINGAFVCICSF